MIPGERRKSILELLKNKKVVSVNELAKLLKTTTATIRRDLNKLHKENLLDRVHGGARYFDLLVVDVPPERRRLENVAIKEKIAEKACEFVDDGSTIILDSGSTTLFMGKVLSLKKDVTVITNSIEISIEFSEYNNLNVICTGGLLRKETFDFVGSIAESIFDDINADYLFLCTGGISSEIGITEPDIQVASIKTKMIESSKKVVLVTDSTKFLRSSMVSVCSIDKIDYIITDSMAPKEELEAIKNKGVDIIYI